MFKNTSGWRRWWFAPKAATAPGETLTMAAGLPCQMLWPYGREPTSRAFFSAPGMERLYSGVTNSTASVVATSSRNRSQAGGGLSVSRSGS